MNRGAFQFVVSAALAALLTVSQAADAGPVVIDDEPDDAVIRRTDPGADGPLGPGAVLPDISSISLNGLPGASQHILELEVVFEGLVNPPGPLGLGLLPFDPFLFGPSPVYGFVDIDVDHNRDTGGELGSAARLRYLANIARFGEVPEKPANARTAFDGVDVDSDFNTAPQVERSGADFALVLCGCFEVGVVETFGDGDGEFNAGDTWVVSGRFFQRAGGYEEASAAFGGSFFGLYDPVVTLGFSHDPAEDRTTLTLLFPLTMAGAAMLAGEAPQPIDLDVSNHFSMVEALDDIIAGAEGGLAGPVHVLTYRWAGENPMAFLDPEEWRATALVGTSYALKDPGGALYVWTDAVGDHERADFDANGMSDPMDLVLFDNALLSRDGGPRDADGMVNGSVAIPSFGPNFSAYDVDGNGGINAQDRVLVVPPGPLFGDANGDCEVDFADITSILTNWGAAYPCCGAPSPGDSNHNGAVNFTDITDTLTAWGATCS